MSEQDKIYEFCMNLAAESSANKSELDTTNALINAAYALEKLNRRNAAEATVVENRDCREINDSDKKEEIKKPCPERIYRLENAENI